MKKLKVIFALETQQIHLLELLWGEKISLETSAFTNHIL